MVDIVEALTVGQFYAVPEEPVFFIFINCYLLFDPTWSDLLFDTKVCLHMGGR
jgi:hypothetical protein